MRKLIVFGALTAILATALPARALPNLPQEIAPSVAARVASPGSGSTVSGTVSVRGEASSSAGLKRIDLFINNIKVATTTFEGIKTSGSVSYSWDTTHQVGSSALAANGGYTLRVDASANGGSRESTPASVNVDNSPGAVQGVQVTSAGQSATVTWNANPEPDIAGYKVVRDSQPVAEVQGTSYSEDLQPGEYSYQVIALRRSPSGTRAGEPSAPIRTTVAPPPAPATGGSGGSSGGGSTQTVGGSNSAIARGNTQRGFVTSSGEHLGITGLPGGVGIPDIRGLPSIPTTTSESLRWGSYEERLPYKFPKQAGQQPTIEATNIAAMSPWRIIPPDGLKWLAAGLFLVVAAALLQFVSAKILKPAETLKL